MRKASARELSDILGDHLTYGDTFMAALDAGRYDLVLCPAPGWSRCPVSEPAKSDRPASKDKAVQAAHTAEQGSVGLPVGVQVALGTGATTSCSSASRRSRPMARNEPTTPACRCCDHPRY